MQPPPTMYAALSPMTSSTPSREQLSSCCIQICTHFWQKTWHCAYTILFTWIVLECGGIVMCRRWTECCWLILFSPDLTPRGRYSSLGLVVCWRQSASQLLASHPGTVHQSSPTPLNTPPPSALQHSSARTSLAQDISTHSSHQPLIHHCVQACCAASSLNEVMPPRYNNECVCVCVAWNRWTYQEFFSRYRVLMKQKDVLPDRKLTCKNVLEQLVQVQQQHVIIAFGMRWIYYFIYKCGIFWMKLKVTTTHWLCVVFALVPWSVLCTPKRPSLIASLLQRDYYMKASFLCRLNNSRHCQNRMCWHLVLLTLKTHLSTF